MNKELFEALELLEKDKKIPVDYMIEKIEAALISAFKKEYGNNTNVRITIDKNKRDLRVYQQKEVVAVVDNPETQISLTDAKMIAKKYKIGSFVDTEVKPKNFRRLSATAAKSVIIQAVREGERKIQQEAYESKHGEIITAVVNRIDAESGNIILNTDNGTVVLTKNEQIPNEVFNYDQRVKVYVSEVNKESKGPIVTLSRTNPGLVRKMFELEIPEIADGIVVIKGISREAGSRTKIAVQSLQPEVDAVGSCIGSHGCRVNPILDELNGEKIDIINYSDNPEEYIAAALAPASVVDVVMTGERSARVTVAEDQLSLAIGKEGQNARLAARLTGYKVDIKPEGYIDIPTEEN